MKSLFMATLRCWPPAKRNSPRLFRAIPSEANSTSRNAISPWPLYEVNPGGTCGNGSRTAGNMCRKFDFFADAGEYFWVPYMHKTAGHTFALLFEAKPGGLFDRFDGLRSGGEVTEVAKDIISKHAPWERHFVDDVEYVSEDRHGWLVGRFPPTVRQGYGRLPSGGLVMPVGDTAILFDPVCGQGGNFANRSAKFVAQYITANADNKFDELWMTKVNYLLWSAYGKYQCAFNNTFLKPLSPSAQLVVDTACSSDTAADAFYYGFPHPQFHGAGLDRHAHRKGIRWTPRFSG